ncbi:MAG: hypothetical protein E6R08_06310 [Nevskiaceae bacterium]|nr:MAG: hypothetical protein E6R08_06310 [Nevskiaceae bacterium]
MTITERLDRPTVRIRLSSIGHWEAVDVRPESRRIGWWPSYMRRKHENEMHDAQWFCMKRNKKENR